MQVDDAYRPVPDQLRRNLGLLDGDEDYAYLMYYVPDDAGWPDGDGYRDSDYGGEYIQSAGSAGALTIEIRRREQDGEFHQYVVGHRGSDALSDDVELKVGEHSVRVRPSEVFAADEAADIFYQYFQTRTVIGSYALRELDLT